MNGTMQLGFVSLSRKICFDWVRAALLFRTIIQRVPIKIRVICRVENYHSLESFSHVFSEVWTMSWWQSWMAVNICLTLKIHWKNLFQSRWRYGIPNLRLQKFWIFWFQDWICIQLWRVKSFTFIIILSTSITDASRLDAWIKFVECNLSWVILGDSAWGFPSHRVDCEPNIFMIIFLLDLGEKGSKILNYPIWFIVRIFKCTKTTIAGKNFKISQSHFWRQVFEKNENTADRP